jgi:hypothetical protein
MDIINKLMKKDQQERYQSSDGIIYDLCRCRDNLVNNQIEWFPIAERDRMERFVVPKKLYGREEEIKMLLDAYNRVLETGKSEMFLVSGYSVLANLH